MRPSECIERERRLAAERSTKHWGTVSVNISFLEFPNKEDEENVDKLVALFKQDYRGLNPRYHIPAKIGHDQLKTALDLSGLTFPNLKDTPDSSRGYHELHFPAGFRLTCFQGLHRSQAVARLFPSRHQQLWSVDLYDSDIDPELEVELSESYTAERIPNDGVVYYRIRKYQGFEGREDPFLENRWWALMDYLSPTKKRSLQKITKKPEFVAWRTAFDIQLEIPALGDGMALGVIHKMWTMQCDELCLNYLAHIEKVWKNDICSNNREMMQKIDASTVKAVQLTAPGCCKKDREDLWKKMQSGEIFTAFTEQERRAIWDRLLSASTTRFIPTLHTFFEDLNYLEAPLQSLKRFVTVPRGQTISSVLLGAYKDTTQEPDRVMIQESETTIAFVPGTEADRIDLGVRQVWMCAMRNSTDIPPTPRKREDSRVAKPGYKESARAVHALADLLFRLGFRSDQIKMAKDHSADDVIAHNALLEARPPDRFAYEFFPECKKKITEVFMAARVLPTEDIISVAELDNYVESPKRSGKPSETEQKQIKPLLFADRLHRQEEFDTATAFLVRKSVYLTFFDMPKFDHVNVAPTRRETPNDVRTEQTSTYLTELQNRETQLNQAWQELENEKKKHSQELKDERERLQREATEACQAQVREFKVKMEGRMEEYKKALDAKYNRQLGDQFKEQESLREEKRVLSEKNETLKQVIEQHTDHQGRIQTEIEAQRNINTKAQQHLGQLEEEIKALQKANQKLQTETQQLLNQNESLKAQVEQLGAEKGSIQGDAEVQAKLQKEKIETLLDTEQQLKAQVQQLLNQNESLVAQVQQLGVNNANLAAQAKDQERKIMEQMCEVEARERKLMTDNQQLVQERNRLNEQQQNVLEEKKKLKDQQSEHSTKMARDYLSLDTHRLRLVQARKTDAAHLDATPETVEIRPRQTIVRTKRRRLLEDDTEEQIQGEQIHLVANAGDRPAQIGGLQQAQSVESDTEMKGQEETKTESKQLLSLWKQSKFTFKPLSRTKGISSMKLAQVSGLEGSDPTSIVFSIRELDRIKAEIVPAVEVKQKALEIKKGGYDIYDQNGFVLFPETCYEHVMGDGSRTVIVRPK